MGDVIEGQFQAWVSDTIYNIPEIVLGSDDNYYKSLTDNNQGNDPISSPSNWRLIDFVQDSIIYDENGNEILEFTATASAVTHVEIKNAATGNKPKIGVNGEADTGIIIEDTSGNEILIAETVNSAVNEVTVTNAATGNAPSISTTGGDTNIDLDISPKGTGKTKTDNITAKTTNGDLNLTGNGTGEVTIDGNTVGNATGEIPISNGTVNIDLNAEIFNGTQVDAFTGSTSSITAGSQDTIDLTLTNVTNFYGMSISCTNGNDLDIAAIDSGGYVYICYGEYSGGAFPTAPGAGTVRVSFHNTSAGSLTYNYRILIYGT